MEPFRDGGELMRPKEKLFYQMLIALMIMMGILVLTLLILVMA